MWRALPFEERAAIFLRAAELLAGPWRDTLNAATMLGQSKTAIQAEIDAACEFIDFLRFNVFFARKLLAEQPQSSPGVWNRMDHRPLEGFVYAVTPFNFTAIAGNLPSAPALLGNTVVWKPGPTQQFAAHFTMRSSRRPACPPEDQHGHGRARRSPRLCSPIRTGRHPLHARPRFSSTCADRARTSPATWLPATGGETGGKDFVVRTPVPTSTRCTPP